MTVDVPATEIGAIAAEVQRLLGIYTSGSFQNYARGFLDVLDAKSLPSGLYRTPPPPSPQLSLKQKVGLAQCAQDAAPLPVEWALTWLENDTSGRLPMAATRCKSEFQRLFAIRYAEAYGKGLILPKNKTKLRLDYHAASGSFHGWDRSVVFRFDLPDVTVLTSPVKKLRSIAESCCENLAGYSRRRAKTGADPDTLECIAELPYALWPDNYRTPVEKIRALVAASGQPLALPFETVQGWMPPHAALGKSQWRSFVGRLAEAGLGVEPDPGIGGTIPAPGTRVAFFSLGTERRVEQASARYRAAALTLQLAVAVACADGTAQDLDRSALVGRLEEWLHFAATEKARLNAHLRRVLAEAPRITGLKRQIKAMDRATRKAVGNFVVSIAQADGTITKAERKMLERIFKLLELDLAHLPPVTPEEPEVLVTASEAPTVYPIRPPAAPAFVLDPVRVRELQAETERVATLLTGIFNAEEESDAPASLASSDSADPETSAEGLWGLSSEHSDLARKLLERAHWTRAELEELADDRQIMLDGALETINEACLDATGQQLLEGSDPVEVNRDVLHAEQAA
jgi:tellurite resistance protein